MLIIKTIENKIKEIKKRYNITYSEIGRNYSLRKDGKVLVIYPTSKEAKYMDALNMIKKAKRSGAIDSFAQVNLFKALEVFKSTSRRSTQVSRFKNKSKKESYLLRIDKDSVSVIVEPLEEKNAKTKNCSNLLSWL